MKKIKIYMLSGLAIIALLSCEKEEIKPTKDDNQNSTKNLTTNSVGEGGSLAQFTIVEDYMYTLDNKSIKVFDISTATSPQLVNTVDLGFGIETIHANNGHIFIGTNTGVRIVDATDPVNITEISEISHVTSCDPVVTNPDYAFSTIRGGTECGGMINQLDIIDISDLNNPTLFQTFQLENPFGLGIDRNQSHIVYVCDGNNGLKVFDISDMDDIKMVKHYEKIYAKDVISESNGVLLVLGLDAIMQYDSTDPLNLEVISEIII